jgi:hypothetical protein
MFSFFPFNLPNGGGYWDSDHSVSKETYEDFPNKEHNANEHMRCLEHEMEVKVNILLSAFAHVVGWGGVGDSIIFMCKGMVHVTKKQY